MIYQLPSQLLHYPNLDLETALGICTRIEAKEESAKVAAKGGRFDPLTVVKVEQGVASDGEDNFEEDVTEPDLKEEEDGDQYEQVFEKDPNDMKWKVCQAFENDDLDIEEERSSPRKHNLKRDRANVSR